MRVLIVDDEIKTRETIKGYLLAKGFDVALAENGEVAVELCENNNFDLVILDIVMPKMNGVQACREIRKFSSVPILFMSVLGEEQDVLNAYQSGGDDYIVKPFPLAVFYEKCLAMIKRYKGAGSDSKIVVGNITLDISTCKAYVNQIQIKLSSRDFELLAYLCQNKGIVLSRELILTRIWGCNYDGDARVVDTHIKRLRKTLGESASQIKTIIGVGYSVEEA